MSGVEISHTSFTLSFKIFRQPHCGSASHTHSITNMNNRCANAYEPESAQRTLVRILLQVIPSYIDECTGSTVISEFGNEGFSLLDEALESCG
jgi:hypothetical protein